MQVACFRARSEVRAIRETRAWKCQGNLFAISIQCTLSATVFVSQATLAAEGQPLAVLASIACRVSFQARS